MHDYILEEHHQRLLEEALTALDRCRQARLILEKEGLTTLDRYGRPKAHPAVAIERDSRADFARLLRQLDLDGEPDPSRRRL